MQLALLTIVIVIDSRPTVGDGRFARVNRLGIGFLGRQSGLEGIHQCAGLVLLAGNKPKVGRAAADFVAAMSYQESVLSQ
jgi:hypothetical protein